MKLVKGKTGLMIRLGVLVTAMLLGQQAMAVGTRAATLVENTATVDYSVATVPQTQLSDTISFVVDRRVDFTMVTQGAALVPVTPGGTDYFVDFLLTNTSNSVLDFNVTLTQMIGGTVRGQTDDADMALVEFAVSADTVVNGNPDPVRGAGNSWVDELEADAAIRIRVFGDAALAMVNGEIAGVDLSLTGADGGAVGVEGAVLVELPDTRLGVENVFADAGNDNIEADQDGFIVVSANLAVTKSYAVIAGDLGSGLAIPGATVEYTITIVNSSTTTAADPVQIGDVLDGDVTFVLGGYGGANLDFEIDNGGAVSQCSAAADGDDCVEAAGVITVGGGGTISLAASTTLTLTYQVLIPNPAITP